MWFPSNVHQTYYALEHRERISCQMISQSCRPQKALSEGYKTCKQQQYQNKFKIITRIIIMVIIRIIIRISIIIIIVVVVIIIIIIIIITTTTTTTNNNSNNTIILIHHHLHHHHQQHYTPLSSTCYHHRCCRYRRNNHQQQVVIVVHYRSRCRGYHHHLPAYPDMSLSPLCVTLINLFPDLQLLNIRKRSAFIDFHC